MPRSGQTQRTTAAPARRDAPLRDRDARPLFYALSGELAEALDDDEQDTVYGYSEPAINELVDSLLRGVALDGHNRTIAEDEIRVLDRVFTKAPALPQPIVVHRGFAAGRSFQVGDTFTDPGFFSTTLDRDYAERFAARADGEHVVVAEVELPAGTRVAPLGDRLLAEYPSEEEVIVHRGSSFQVVSVEPELRFRLLPA
jgi:hypothetical protein